MGRLMRDNIVRETRKDNPAREMVTRVGRRSREIAKEEPIPFRAVKGVRLAQCVRVYSQALYVFFLPFMLIGPWRLAIATLGSRAGHVRRPERASPQSAFKVANRRHRDRVHHLLVKSRVPL